MAEVIPQVLVFYFECCVSPLINHSIETAKFPSDLKYGEVSPHFKKDDKLDKTKYRPVSLLKAVSKVIETIVNKKVLNFLENNQLLPKSQHGFRPNHSTFTAVSSPLCIISSTSSGLLGFSGSPFSFLSSMVMYSFALDC